MNFKTMAELDVPTGRRGKHKEIVSHILSDLDQRKPGSAISLRLKELPESEGEGPLSAEPCNTEGRTQCSDRE